MKKISKNFKKLKFELKHVALPLIAIIAATLIALFTLPKILNSPIFNKISEKAIIQTNYGSFTITFNKNTPDTVKNFTKLAKEGYYNGTRFHRIVTSFMIQGGDPLSKNPDLKNFWGKGGPGYTFKDEINQGDKFAKGSVGMANNGPDTNGSQFFILTADKAEWLDQKHTLFGQVTEGLTVVEKIGNSPANSLGFPPEDVIITNVLIK